MNEYFLHYVWRYRLYSPENLVTSAGEPIKILYPGLYNRSEGGPDFLNARLRIGQTLWVGHVEIHTRSSDWNRHKHYSDPHYKNVILHVVFQNDVEISLYTPGDLAVLELKGRIAPDLFQKYKLWQSNSAGIACDIFPGRIDQLVWVDWKEKLLCERLEDRSQQVRALVDESKGYWPEAFYRRMAYHFGFNANSVAFELLARQVDLQLLTKYRTNRQYIEALLFGCSGLLPEKPIDDYSVQLVIDFAFLKHKHQLTSLSPGAWITGGVRPSNFPTLRIAQFADLICRSENLLAYVLEEEHLPSIIEHFHVSAGEYWKNHYAFDRAAKGGKNLTKMGQASVESIIINAVAPVVYAYGQFHREERYIDKALNFFEICKAESNHIVREWRIRGAELMHAGDSQSLKQLYSNYCVKKRCLECGIGHALLKEQIHDTSNS